VKIEYLNGSIQSKASKIEATKDISHLKNKSAKLLNLLEEEKKNNYEVKQRLNIKIGDRNLEPIKEKVLHMKVFKKHI
jgi:hypothetical protein